ncbi:ATP-dependent DNA helicase PcrA [Thermoanaerobacterium thermosaccharolyticum DSM 571]|uniref:ATP-dependent DNA helicase n=1 Tax=Thermoanaerobacterium thermosaccharolyticum (strain ATCC 7956 / DSM 571 / NCIMB 9385 / NCA 3814 / NCTC 13789 / WDCM 00135 / 2032) TaxID=580327 RepID=D9TQN4_THETC|nr:DNA helicase PcrA [Thermoanaerobacterium thermosaccharolyticum]ADL69570.1 ATP-dependent DNA helicase PcrA [Thermoanaerobacterium thermosaccharolyticum DSM 571]
MNILDKLNDRQKEAVVTTEGPLLILAGAGSGKTRVLTHRIAYLIKEKRVSPANILAITFTNKAAQEMKDRVESLLGYVGDIWVSTFHSACVRILRRDIEKIGYDKNFVIYDTQDQKSLVSDCIKELDLNEKQYTPKSMLSAISKAKDKMISPDEYLLEFGNDYRNKKVADVYKLYQKKLKKDNALDFDDIIIKTIELFKKDEGILRYYQDKFRYIMVDEYQDTNRPQYEFVNLLAKRYRNLCVVGDDDQSIYGWRGADIKNILDFEKDYPEAKVIKLEQNYRSTQIILDAANNVIDNNIKRKKKQLWTDNKDGEKIIVCEVQNEREEANFIIDRIKDLIANGRKYSDFAILYRTNAQSRIFEEACMMNDIPYKLVGALRFYDRKEIKDIIAYLRILVNPYDDVSLKRIINVPKRGIGESTVSALEQYAREHDTSMYFAIPDVELKGRARKVLDNFKNFIDDLINQLDFMNIIEVIDYILEKTGYMDELKADDTKESESRIENINEFIGAAREFMETSEDKSLESFLSGITLVSDIDTAGDIGESVVLMTLHSAKGLEFPVVFMAGMEEGIFPSSMSFIDEHELEEERRLCYVGITRAKERLFMTYARTRNLYGKPQYNTASRFINEIPQDLIVEYDKGAIKRNDYESVSSYINTFARKANDKANYNPGDKVEHKLWGIGTVVNVEGIGEERELTVAFPNVGIKRLSLKYAPIRAIS